ncbi:MAG: hypothetical protein HYZ53_30670 [Planctomycetes bacterium]|nr:hypothetical protein [Planctomycetota bacterium]
MARMFPEEFRADPEVPETLAEAERGLYGEFQRELPEEYVVFHRRPWHAPNATGTMRDGVASFVLAHEGRGVLVLEARAGGAAFDARAGRWHSVDAEGGRSAAEDDPLQAVVRAKLALARRLRGLPAAAGRRWLLGHAVAFPQIELEPALVAAAGVPAVLLLDRRALGSTRAWVEAALAYWAERERQPPPGGRGLEVLSSLLAVGFEIRPLVGSQIARHEFELARLTVDQYRVLDGLSRFRRALICGCAGSGKTMLALEKVRRLASQGLRPLYVCYNRNLRDACRAQLKAWPNATADSFHELCVRWALKAGLKITGPREDPSIPEVEFYRRLLPEALREAVKRSPDDRYDGIVVDEGQDFHAAWWGPLESALLDRRKGFLYVFYDDNQMLYTEELSFPPVDSQYDLTENCRNLRRIHDLVVRFYKADRKIISRAPPGERPEVLVYRSEAELLAMVERTVLRFTKEHGIAPRDIAVLTGHGQEKSSVWRARRFGGHALVTQSEAAAGGGGLLWSSVHAFKGLERAAVILAEIEPISQADLETVLYVGCSRARVHLAVIAAETAARLARLEGAGAGSGGGRRQGR